MRHKSAKGNYQYCFYCGVRLRPPTRSRDHVTPLSRGGSNSTGNLVFACKECNTRKRNMNLEEYRAFTGGHVFPGEKRQG